VDESECRREWCVHNLIAATGLHGKYINTGKFRGVFYEHVEENGRTLRMGMKKMKDGKGQ